MTAGDLVNKLIEDEDDLKPSLLAKYDWREIVVRHGFKIEQQKVTVYALGDRVAREISRERAYRKTRIGRQPVWICVYHSEKEPYRFQIVISRSKFEGTGSISYPCTVFNLDAFLTKIESRLAAHVFGHLIGFYNQTIANVNVAMAGWEDWFVD